MWRISRAFDVAIASTIEQLRRRIVRESKELSTKESPPHTHTDTHMCTITHTSSISVKSLSNKLLGLKQCANHVATNRVSKEGGEA